MSESKHRSYSPAIGDIIAERVRQIAKEGWTPDHDDIHTDGSLARAAAAYALVGSLCDRVRACLYPSSWGAVIRSLWPAAWDETWFKPKDRRYDLVRAGALIVAEIERIDRAEGAAS